MIDQQLPPATAAVGSDAARPRARGRGWVAVIVGLAGAVLLVGASWLLWKLFWMLALLAFLVQFVVGAGVADAPARPAPVHQPRGAAATAPQAATQDVAGAVAAAEHYVDAFEHGYLTGDSAPLRETFTPRCATCASEAQQMDDFRAAGIRVQGYALRPVSLEAVGSRPTEQPTEVLVHASVDITPAVATTPDGTRWDGVAGVAESDVHLVWDGAQWKVAGVYGDPWTVLVHMFPDDPQQPAEPSQPAEPGEGGV